MGFCKVTLTFESMNEILRCHHSNESSLPVLSHGAICLSKFLKMKFANLVEICLWPHLAVKGLKYQLREFDKRSRHFYLGDHFVNSQNLPVDSVWILLGEN